MHRCILEMYKSVAIATTHTEVLVDTQGTCRVTRKSTIATRMFIIDPARALLQIRSP